MLTFYCMLINIEILYHFLFIARGHAGCWRVLPEPTASLLMTEMSQLKRCEARTRYSKFFSSSPILCAIPTNYYAASARYLAFCVESITRQRLIIRRPLPLLGAIVAKQYITRIVEKIHWLEHAKVITPESLRLRLIRGYQSINEG